MKKLVVFVIVLSLFLPAAGLAKAPVVTTLTASNITFDTTTLNGQVDPQGGNDITYNFEYGSTSAYGNTTTPQPKTGQAAENVSFNLTGLLPNATYHYRLVARNTRNETGQGADMTFKTLPKKPDVTTLAASNVTSNTATLNGQVNPNGDNTTYFFIYGLPGGYRLQAPMPSRPPLAPGRTPVHVSVNVTVSANKTFHYKIIAQNSAGQSHGTDMSFKTPPAPGPEVKTLAAANITRNSADLNGQLNNIGNNTTCNFEYGSTSAYGNTTPAQTAPPAAGPGWMTFTKNVTGLTPNTTYHYRSVCQNSAGQSQGTDMSFKTSASGTAAPVRVVTGAATNVSASRVTLNGQIPAQFSSGSKYYFEWGTTTAYGKTTKSIAPARARSKVPVAVSANLTGPFRPGGTYHYRIVFVDITGKRYFGQDQVFKIPMM